MTTSTDEELYNMYEFLIQKSIKPYILILEKWVGYGILDDPYKEFFIIENIDEDKMQQQGN